MRLVEKYKISQIYDCSMFYEELNGILEEITQTGLKMLYEIYQDKFKEQKVKYDSITLITGYLVFLSYKTTKLQYMIEF